MSDLRECGQGRILRTISARGPGGVLVSATQTIWVVDCDPFYIDRRDYCSTLDDIAWPDCQGLGTTVEGCGADTDPEIIGKPRILNGADDNCALIAIQNFDEVFTIEPDACFKILRRWVVIDWCQYDPNISATEWKIGIHTSDQSIRQKETGCYLQCRCLRTSSYKRTIGCLCWTHQSYRNCFGFLYSGRLVEL